ncbi:TetR/AcrR family transcriptional regulator [Streptomyces sp. NPDC059785]|uniref:TetR/AcrR family transcriptional regulator n=1 Tax=unclassified Streptomyces TaxID=2593676 RepID=UPI003662BDE7
MSDDQDGPAGPPDARAQEFAVHDGQLLQRVAAAMRELGPGASMGQIARAAGLDPRDLYRRFPTPEALRQALAASFYDRLLAHIEQARQLPADQQMEYVLRTVGLHLAVSHRILPHRFGEIADAGQRERMYALIKELLATGMEAGTVTGEVTLSDVATVIWGMRGVIVAADGHAADAWERHIDIALAGLRNPRLTFTRPPLDDEALDAVISRPGGATH